MRDKLARRAALALVCAALIGCQPIMRNHGYMPVEEQLARIAVGVDTRGSVQRKIGRPATDSLFIDETAWYYVSSTVLEDSYKEPRVIDRKVLRIAFDDAGRVTAVNRYGLEDGRVIDLVTRTTPTLGSQLTVLEQLFGNLGAATGEALLGDN